jgi:hypothetical protein
MNFLFKRLVYNYIEIRRYLNVYCPSSEPPVIARFPFDQSLRVTNLEETSVRTL